MNIKQMEEKSGLSRANIRYYEQEGLLTPARLDNGYRDYSDADLAALQKVQLLRQLGLPMETIRRLQTGEESLPDVLAARMDELQAGAAAAIAARMVCDTLRSSGAQYDTLDAEKYLAETARLTKRVAEQTGAKTTPPTVAETPAADAPPPAHRLAAPAAEVRGYTPLPLPDGWKQVAPMPWRRYIARLLDLHLYSLLVHLVLFGALRWFPPQNAGLSWGVTALAMVMMVLVEPLWLMWFGTTPGKWVLGIRLVWRGGRKFFYSDGLARTGKVLAQGFGFNLPVLSWLCLWRAWRNEKHGTYHDWEDPAEWYLVREKDKPSLRLPLCLVLCLAVAVGEDLVEQNGYLPAHYTAGRGVTARQFVDNFNAYNDYFDLYLEQLNPDGSWAEKQYTVYHTVVLEDGTEQILVEEPPAPLVIETDADGYVTRVSHSWQSQPYEAIISSPALRMQLCLLSFAAAQPGVNPWQLVMRDDFYDRQIGAGVESAAFTVNGVRVQYTVTAQGYITHDAMFAGNQFPHAQQQVQFWRWGDTVDPNAYVRIEFTLEKLPG